MNGALHGAAGSPSPVKRNAARPALGRVFRLPLRPQTADA